MFGSQWLVLDKPLRVCLVDGRCLDVDKYAQLIIEINGFSFPETVSIINEFAEEVVVEGKRIKFPELIVGAGTMDKYGIALTISRLDGGSSPFIFTCFKAPHRLLLNGLPKPLTTIAQPVTRGFIAPRVSETRGHRLATLQQSLNT